MSAGDTLRFPYFRHLRPSGGTCHSRDPTMSFLEKTFHLAARGTSVGTEIRAGLTTFVTMAYILPVNIAILSAAGLDQGAVFMATALSAVIGSILMGLLAGLPFALAPGMGLNAFFAYTVVLTMGYSPAFALAAVLFEGLIFFVLSVTGVRTLLLNAIPKQLRLAIAAGIGLFIMFIALSNAGIVIDNPTLLVQVNPEVLRNPPVCLAVIGMIITMFLWVRKIKGSLLLGILLTWGLGILAELAGWYVPNPEARVFSLIPSGLISTPPSVDSLFGLCFQGVEDALASRDAFMSFIVVTLTFLYLDIFDTLGTFAGVMTKARMVTPQGDFPKANEAFASDAIATTVGAVLGTSTVTTFVESASGVADGGRTGLTAITVGLLFLVSIFFFPIVSAIPAFATAPALMMVGIMMCEPLREFEWTNPEALIPGIMTMLFMVVGYSISAGIVWGLLFWILMKLAAGKARDITPFLWCLGLIFVLKMVFFD